jgi:hypothetical protein
MGEKIDLGVSHAGIRTVLEKVNNTGHLGSDYLVHRTQDVTAALDANKAQATHNDGYSASRELRRVAHLPWAFIQHCRDIEGWNPLDPEYADRLKRVLNDPEYAFLRTAPGKLDVKNGQLR